MGEMLFVDSDNAMGSSHGDIDDGFALAAVLRSGVTLAGIGSVAGNAPEEQAWRNNRTIAELCGCDAPVLRAAAVAPFLASLGMPVRFLALGPLSNLALIAERNLASEAILVGGNLSSPGRWPPFFPHEFNLTKDLPALRTVWRSELPLTILPLDVARQMRVTRGDLDPLRTRLGEHLRRHSGRWFRRARLLKWSDSIPLFDLPAAMHAIDPAASPADDAGATLHPNGWIDFRKGERRVRVIRRLDPRSLWESFVTLVNSESTSSP